MSMAVLDEAVRAIAKAKEEQRREAPQAKRPRHENNSLTEPRIVLPSSTSPPSQTPQAPSTAQQTSTAPSLPTPQIHAPLAPGLLSASPIPSTPSNGRSSTPISVDLLGEVRNMHKDIETTQTEILAREGIYEETDRGSNTTPIDTASQVSLSSNIASPANQVLIATNPKTGRVKEPPWNIRSCPKRGETNAHFLLNLAYVDPEEFIKSYVNDLHEEYVWIIANQPPYAGNFKFLSKVLAYHNVETFKRPGFKNVWTKNISRAARYFGPITGFQHRGLKGEPLMVPVGGWMDPKTWRATGMPATSIMTAAGLGNNAGNSTIPQNTNTSTGASTAPHSSQSQNLQPVQTLQGNPVQPHPALNTVFQGGPGGHSIVSNGFQLRQRTPFDVNAASVAPTYYQTPANMNDGSHLSPYQNSWTPPTGYISAQTAGPVYTPVYDGNFSQSQSMLPQQVHYQSPNSHLTTPEHASKNSATTSRLYARSMDNAPVPTNDYGRHVQSSQPGRKRSRDEDHSGSTGTAQPTKKRSATGTDFKTTTQPMMTTYIQSGQAGQSRGKRSRSDERSDEADEAQQSKKLQAAVAEFESTTQSSSNEHAQFGQASQFQRKRARDDSDSDVDNAFQSPKKQWDAYNNLGTTSEHLILGNDNLTDQEHYGVSRAMENMPDEQNEALAVGLTEELHASANDEPETKSAAVIEPSNNPSQPEQSVHSQSLVREHIGAVKEMIGWNNLASSLSEQDLKFLKTKKIEQLERVASSSEDKANEHQHEAKSSKDAGLQYQQLLDQVSEKTSNGTVIREIGRVEEIAKQIAQEAKNHTRLEQHYKEKSEIFWAVALELRNELEEFEKAKPSSIE